MKNIGVVQLASYSSPAIVQEKNKDWVKYGEDDNYYQYLIDLYHTSPTNNACVRGTADLIYGQGLEVIKADRHLKGYLEYKMLFEDDCIRKLTLDLKMLGQCAIQLVKSKDKSRYAKAYHFPVQTLRAEKANEDGEIEGYYYHHDWAKKKRTEQPKRFPAFGFDEADKECILFIKPYSTGSEYYAPVDYQGGTQWSELEGEISNYHLNNIKNGLAPSMLINFNNGEPPEETKDIIEGQIADKFSGSSNAGRFIIAFNDNADSKADITPIQLSDAHNQYQFLSDECMRKIMVSHRITSPMLLGIKDTSGLGNNADEIKTASTLFDNTVIRPFQNLIISAVKKVLIANKTPVDLYFKTLQPLEFTDLSGKNVDSTTQEKEYGFSVQMSAVSSVDGMPLYSTPEEAIAKASSMGCKGYHAHNTAEGKTLYMPCEDHNQTVNLADSYTDYPQGASSNAKRALEWVEKHGWGSCGEATGKRRASQLANKEPISRDTIARMASFKRHQQHKDVPYSEGCGGLMWDAWGGDAGINWAIRKLEEIDSQKQSQQLSCDHVELTDEVEAEWLEFLEDKGEIINEDEWELIEEVEADPDEPMPTELTARYSSPDKKSKDDKGIYKIRYRYGPNKLKENSRHFCKQMIASRNKGVVYRREDIDIMSRNGVNSDFAPKGKASYSIWKFKGGVYCHHAWYRLTYRRKSEAGRGSMVKPLTPSEKSSGRRDMDNYNPVPNSEANRDGVPFNPPSWDTAKTRPIDMPSKGKLQ